MSRAYHLLQRLLHDLRLRREDIRRNASATSVNFTEHTDGSFSVTVVWLDKGSKKEHTKTFDRAYCFGDAPEGAEYQQKKSCWYWREIVKEVLQVRGVFTNGS